MPPAIGIGTILGGLGTAATVGSSLGLFGGGDSGIPSASNQQANISNALWQSTQPVRSNLLDTMTDATSGNFNLSDYPAFAPLKLNAENQYGQAKDNIMGMVPQGGQLYDALAQNENARAGALTNMGGSIFEQIMNNAQQAAFQTPGTSLMGLQGAAQGQQFGRQQDNQMWGSLGSFLADDAPDLLEGFGGLFGGGTTGFYDPDWDPSWGLG